MAITSTSPSPLGSQALGNSSLSPLQPTELSLLPGVNVLIEGPTGTGKTHAIGTLVDYSPNLEVFFLALESGLESLFGYWSDRGMAIPTNLHWHSLSSISGGFESLIKAAKDIGDFTQDSLHKLQDHTKGQRNHFEKLLRVMANFQDQRTDKSYGAVDTWGPDRAIVVDGLTGLGNMALSMVIGQKPVKSQADWGIAQDQVERFLRLCCDGVKAHFVLLSHVERELDQIQGGVKVTVSTLGRALPPKIPPMFSDVILSVRQGTQWTWSTANALCDLKTRNLPVAEGIKPDFRQILDKWVSRGGRFSPRVKA